MRILIDTNLLLRIADPQHTHHDRSAAALELLREQGHELRTVPQNIYEYWVVATRPLAQNGLGFTPRETSSHLERVRYFFPLLRDERAILEQWERLVTTYSVRGKPAHDVRLVAAMCRHGLTHILTFNAADFKRFTNITVLSPDAVVAAG